MKGPGPFLAEEGPRQKVCGKQVTGMERGMNLPTCKTNCFRAVLFPERQGGDLALETNPLGTGSGCTDRGPIATLFGAFLNPPKPVRLTRGRLREERRLDRAVFYCSISSYRPLFGVSRLRLVPKGG